VSPKLSEAEKIVIGVIFKDPRISLVNIAKVLDETEYSRKSSENADVRTVSKFKSVGLRKIKQGLENLADALRLERSLQGPTKEEREEEKKRNEILLRNGILTGFDFRDDREVYLFFTIKDQAIIPWQAHVCNRKCEEDCLEILEVIRSEHGLNKPSIEQDIKDQYKNTLDEIYTRNITEEKREEK
jgi:hypothetical protein